MSNQKCALSIKKDNSGSCNVIVNGKLRVKKTARIQNTLAVEKNLQVYNDATIGQNLTARRLHGSYTNVSGTTGTDTVIFVNAGDESRRRWIEYRGGGNPDSRAGAIYSFRQDDLYFVSVNNTSINAKLQWFYGTSLDFNSATGPIMALDKDGNVTATSFTTFTGGHVSYNGLYNVDDLEETKTELPEGVEEYKDLEDGLILSSDAKNTHYSTIVNSTIYTKLSTEHKDKNVIGVSYTSNDRIAILSVGEGGIQVCSEVIDGVVQTPIVGGDYLCSYFDGYATVQDDDLLHNYTVAKSLQDYDFSTDYIEFTKDDKTYRKSLIAVTYHSG